MVRGEYQARYAAEVHHTRSWSPEKSSGPARGADRWRIPRTPCHVRLSAHGRRVVHRYKETAVYHVSPHFRPLCARAVLLSTGLTS